MRTVIFDCDGVLVDSEPIAWATWRELLEPHGIDVTNADVRACTGRGMDTTYARFVARGDLPPFEDVRAQFLDVLRSRYPDELNAFDDARRTLSELAAVGAVVACASSSPRERLDLTLRVTRLEQAFGVTVAGDEVEQAKPAPDIFARAAERLGAEAGDCVVIEDTPHGIEAARAAGMTAVAIRRTHNQMLDLGGADLVIDHLSLEELGPVL